MKCYFRLNVNYVPNQNQSNQRNGNINVNMAQVQTDTSIQSENNRISNPRCHYKIRTHSG
jgi:hypothetical protein